MKKYRLFPHGGSGNHGCEAIVRTTVNMLNENEIILYSEQIDEDIRYLGEHFVCLKSPSKSYMRNSAQYWKAFFNRYIQRKIDAYDALYYQPLIADCDKDSVLLSIGGDNYCYGENEYIYMVNRYIRKKGIKTVLWGCSVEPEAISQKMTEDLKEYDYIFARESITYNALKKINPNTMLFPDPAFTLPSDKSAIPKQLIQRNFIGINMSPLIQSKETISGITIENYRTLIREILNKTEDNIALIPHVVWEANDDRIPLRKLYEEFALSGRVYLIEDTNCVQLKGIISQSRIFIGARTHATIAAYSMCVPTLVVGYSVKARGIATDLFGTDENYVIPVQELKVSDDILKAYQWIEHREKQIREHLEEIMPSYISQAEKAGKFLCEIWE